MVCGPSISRLFSVRNASLPLDQKPAGRVVGIYLFSCQKLWVILNQLLQNKFRTIGSERYALKFAIDSKHVDCVVVFHNPSLLELAQVMAERGTINCLCIRCRNSFASLCYF